MKTPTDNPLPGIIRPAIQSALAGMMVCLPGKVVAFDPKKQSAQVECGIQKQVNGKFQTIPVLSNVRVQFSGDGEWYFYHQVKPGTEGLIHFSQRAIDTWLEQGGPVAPHELRMFSAEDAFFVPGIRSNPNLIPDFVNEGVGLSSYDGATRIAMTNGEIVLKAGSSTMTINDAGVNTESASFTHNSINVGDDHSHPQEPDSAGDTQVDVGPPK